MEPRRIHFSLDDGIIYLDLEGSEPDWLYTALGRLKSLNALPENWDSYGGAPITFEAAYAALTFMALYLSHDARMPTIVPSTDGGLQLEWHRLSGDLEVSCDPGGLISAFHVDASSGEEWEMVEGAIDYSRLVSAVNKVVLDSQS